MESFIYIKENALSDEACDNVIDWFESYPNYQAPGVCRDGEVILESKTSTDMSLENCSEELVNEVLQSLEIGVEEYKARYKFYDDKNNVKGLDNLYYWGITESPNIQRYFPGEGFYEWHCEYSGIPGSEKRVLTWMFYLNTCKNAGTEFKYQNIRTECKKGSLVIWPAYWTHFHRGVVSPSETKYIITGWHSFHGE